VLFFEMGDAIKDILDTMFWPTVALFAFSKAKQSSHLSDGLDRRVVRGQCA